MIKTIKVELAFFRIFKTRDRKVARHPFLVRLIPNLRKEVPKGRWGDSCDGTGDIIWKKLETAPDMLSYYLLCQLWPSPAPIRGKKRYKTVRSNYTYALRNDYCLVAARFMET